MLLIVPFERVDARREAAALAAGTQAQVDGEGDAGRRDVAEGARQPLDGAAVERVRVHALPAVGLAVRRVGIGAAERHEDVEVGAGRQLASAELAEADDDGGDEPAARVARHAVALDLRAQRHQPAGGQAGLGQRGHLTRVAIDVRDAEQVAPHHGQFLRLLDPSQPVAPLRRAEPRREHRRERRTKVGARAPALEHAPVGERREQLGLSDQQLRQEVAAGAEPHEPGEQLGPGGEQLDVARARPGGGEEPLELVERLVGIGALPARVEQHRLQARQGRPERAGVRHQRPALDDHPEVLERALGIGKPGGGQRDAARQSWARGSGRRALAEELAERAVDVAGDGAMLGREAARGDARRGVDADAAREPAELERIVRQGVSLELVQDLQPVLDRAQMHERVREPAPEVRGEVPPLGEPEERLERVALAQPGIVAAVEELERLREELDLPDAAAPELDVARGRLGVTPAQRAVDLPLHAADRGQHALVEAGPIDDLAHEVHEARPDPGIARADARLEQRLPLPQLGALAVVGAVGVERHRDRPHPALGAQPQIDAEGVAFLGDLLDHRHEVAAHAREERAVLEPALRPARGLALGAVDEHEVDVRRVVQLLAAELAHADHGEPRLAAGGVERRAEPRARVGQRVGVRLPQARVGQPRELLGRHGQVRVAEQVAGADTEELAVLEAAQRVQARLARGERPHRLRDVLGELLGQPRAHGARLEQPRQRARAPAQDVGEELARAADARQQRGGARMLGERAEEDGAVDGGGVALQVVERHVGIGRGGKLRQQSREGGTEQLGVAGRRRQGFEIRDGRRGVGEAGPAQHPREVTGTTEETVRDD